MNVVTNLRVQCVSAICILYISFIWLSNLLIWVQKQNVWHSWRKGSLSLWSNPIFADTTESERVRGFKWQNISTTVADPERFDADPDPTFDIDADPDPKLTTYSMYLEKNRTNQIA